MPFCGNCGVAMNEGAKFCTTCGSGNAHSTAGRLKPLAIAMFIVSGFYLLMAITRYNSATHQFIAAFGGGTDGTLESEFFYGFANAIVAFFMFTAAPRVFQKLNRNGLIAFTILMATLPILAWVTWLIPGLLEPSSSG